MKNKHYILLALLVTVVVLVLWMVITTYLECLDGIKESCEIIKTSTSALFGE